MFWLFKICKKNILSPYRSVMPLFGISTTKFKGRLKLREKKDGGRVSQPCINSNPVTHSISAEQPSAGGNHAEDSSHTQEHASLPSPPKIRSEKDLWAVAFARLQERDLELTEDFEYIMRIESSTHGTGDFDSKSTPSLMEDLVSRKLALLNGAQWRFRLGNKSIVLRDKVDSIVKIVMTAKDIILSLGQAVDPIQVGLPLGGVCFLLQVSLYATDAVFLF